MMNRRKADRYKFSIRHKCPVLLTTNICIVYAENEEEAIKLSGKNKSDILEIEKENEPETESNYSRY